MQAGPWSVLTTWACDVRRVASEYRTVQVVAVRTAVMWRQSDALHDDQEDARLTHDVGLGGRRDLFKGPGTHGNDTVLTSSNALTHRKRVAS
jgi:hypothetical protein